MLDARVETDNETGSFAGLLFGRASRSQYTSISIHILRVHPKS